MFSHTRNRTQVITGRLSIRYAHDRMPRIGKTGPSGTRNGRCASGRLMRSISTAAQTTTKANERADARHLADDLNLRDTRRPAPRRRR